MEADYPNFTELPDVNGLSLNTMQSNLFPFADEANTATTEITLGFHIGDLGFSLPANLHCEVLERLPVNPIPNVEPWFSGLMNIRGNIVPVIDLRRLLGKTENSDKKRYLFAIDRGEKTMALWIDGYPQMLIGLEKSLQSLTSLAVLPDRLQPYVTEAYSLNDQVWLKIKLEALFKTLGRQHAT